ncbi:MAG: SNF2-related protein [Opitutales bacterium]
MATERTEQEKLGDLADFALLDLGELYYLADRVIVDRGLRYFRDYAVESLDWDGRARQIVAGVSGSGLSSYEVSLSILEGRVRHECSCPAWNNYGTCKHVVAALAGVFSAFHDFKAGAPEMPEDYVAELRQGLGLRADGSLPDAEAGETGERPKTVLKIQELGSYGGLRVRVVGPVPQAFLQSAGVTLPSSYGVGLSREFFLGGLSRLLKPFLTKAKRAGIPVRVRTSEGEVDLNLAAKPCRAGIEYALEGREVVRRLSFRSANGASLDAEELIAGAFALTAGGTLYSIGEGAALVQELPGGVLTKRYELGAFNVEAAAAGMGEAASDAERPSFRRGRERIEPEQCDSGQVAYSVRGAIYKNAAGEPEALQFRCVAIVDGVEVDLSAVQQLCLDPVLNAHSGGLFGAKRRVRALLDLIRRALSVFDPKEPLDPGEFESEFSELYANAYRHTILTVLRSLGDQLGRFELSDGAVAADSEGSRFLRYQIDFRRLAMFLFSISDARNRRDLHELRGGALPIQRGRSGREELQRMVTAAQKLNFELRIDKMPVRVEPLSISIDARAKGGDIDWFALHPTIACGERNIRPEEWRQLIRGELLLRGEDGALIMPQAAEGEVAGLEALASMLRVDGSSTRKEEGGTSISRLQMLDWIALRRQGVRVTLPPEAESLFESLLHFRELPAFEVPSGCLAKLRGYQKEGCAWIDFLYHHRFGACLADDMGLGKTVQTIAFLVACFEREPDLSKPAPVLIVLPPSLVFNWLDEWARFAPGIRVRDCLRKADWPEALSGTQVILTTYDRVRLDIKELEAQCFPVVVFDEAHNLKNITAARTRAAARLKRGFTLCLTGTPVENNASEFYSVLSAAVPGVFGTHKEFQEAFRKQPDRILGRSRPFVLRRTKSTILKELPRKEEHVLHLEMSALQKEIYTRTVAEVRAEIAEAFSDRPEQQAGIVALAAILRLRQVCVSPELLGKEMPEPAPKFSYLADKLEELQAEGHAALVFSQFIGGLDQLEAIARARGLSWLRMDGRTPVPRRKAIVGDFQSADGPPFFFISLKTGGVGLNLTRANYVFHLDPWWNPAVENQATDRAHRIGQRRAVFVQRLIMQHSIESRMMELKHRKAELFQELIEKPGAKTARTGLSREDFDYLLEG